MDSLDFKVFLGDTCNKHSVYIILIISFVFSADQMMVFLPDESKHTMLPRGMAMVHFDTHRVPPKLSELGLRGLYSSQDYYKMVNEYLEEGIVPQDIHSRIVDGPAAVCGNDYCSAPLFTECYFLLLKK